jgi:hypothetical protein
LEPVCKEDIGNADVHNSHLFTVEKFTADGMHDKFKSRMVMNGNEQDPDMYPDHSSPTVAIHSLLTCLAVAAYNPTYVMAKIDVKGAFVQTEMVGPPVYIKCRKKVTDLMIKTFPGLKRYIGSDGLLHFKLLKALYGCVQASKLWFEKLTKVLRREGYEHSPTDPCVMRRIVGDKICLLLIYVDDILVLADEAELKQVESFFKKEFTWITMNVGNVLSYLSMQIMLEQGVVTMDMSYYLEKVLEGYNNLPPCSTLGKRNFFDVNEWAELSLEAEQKKFHTAVARLLYLLKRARPDIMTVVAFLCTRVTRATAEDCRKLERVLGYLKGTAVTG